LAFSAQVRETPERQTYDALRDSLATGNLAARLYSQRLTGFLDWIERFFGDTGMADRTLFPRAFGLKMPAPLWTASAFDRCLLLALIYPIVTIFVIWVASGHVGPAEAALGLKPDPGGWQGVVAALAVAFILAVAFTAPVALPRLIDQEWTRSRKALYTALIWGALAGAISTDLGVVAALAVLGTIIGALMGFFGLVVGIGGVVLFAFYHAVLSGRPLAVGVIVVILLPFVGADVTAIAVGFATLFAAAGAVLFLLFGDNGYSVLLAVPVAIAVFIGLPFRSSGAAVVAGAVALVIAGPVGYVLALVLFLEVFANAPYAPFLVLALFAGVAFAVVVAIDRLERLRVPNKWHPVYLSAFLPAMIVFCLAGARFPKMVDWWNMNPLLLFVGLLTFINAPFVWASLGLTRALLRRGLELGGWWPYALALVDAGLAVVVTTVLALTMVVGVQAFDALAVYGGEAPVLPLDEQTFKGIARGAPEYWWLYALLLSTMIPSLVNLVIAGASLLRGLPGVPTLLLRFMPVSERAVPDFNRAWIATVLSLQVVGGAIVGIVAQALLATAMIWYIIPFVGLELIKMARDVAAFNVPAQVVQLFGFSL
jgi:hypothetical protein